GVFDLEAHPQFAADDDTMAKRHAQRPGIADRRLRLQPQDDLDILIACRDGFDGEIDCAGDAMGWSLGIAGSGAEPGKADGHAAANGFAEFEVAAVADEQQFTAANAVT